MPPQRKPASSTSRSAEGGLGDGAAPSWSAAREGVVSRGRRRARRRRERGKRINREDNFFFYQNREDNLGREKPQTPTSSNLIWPHARLHISCTKILGRYVCPHVHLHTSVDVRVTEGVMKSRASDTLTVFLAVTTGEEAAGGSRMCSLLLNKLWIAVGMFLVIKT